ncbi:mechanosensitive ion channel family protein [Sulfurospirillum arcachonense]|uniref:mechanosensitive ion channel family protein n=1 Tax=Sulfurospirillum arcachonense TaxID=57666 RepID=UPI0004698118|nr:mechanosensitive ion channel domain-containing protein [Sulfurospirillum arcachonense]
MEKVEQELVNVTKFYDVMIAFFANYSLQILGAVIIFGIGISVSKYVHKIVLNLLKTKIDETLSSFVANLIRFLIIGMMGILALGKLGISIGPFVAALGALSLTAGLALQGSVSNFAAGVVLIVTKPFKIGDTITTHNVYGEVEEIKLAYTVLINEDKEQITIPNKYMIGDVLVNSFSYRIVEGSVGIAYDSDAKKCIEVIKKVISTCKEVSSEQEPIVGIENFGDSSIDIGYRYWAPTKNYFKTQYDVNLKILDALNNEKITIPFPQREVRMV